VPRDPGRNKTTKLPKPPKHYSQKNFFAASVPGSEGLINQTTSVGPGPARAGRGEGRCWTATNPGGRGGGGRDPSVRGGGRRWGGGISNPRGTRKSARPPQGALGFSPSRQDGGGEHREGQNKHSRGRGREAVPPGTPAPLSGPGSRSPPRGDGGTVQLVVSVRRWAGRVCICRWGGEEGSLGGGPGGGGNRVRLVSFRKGGGHPWGGNFGGGVGGTPWISIRGSSRKVVSGRSLFEKVVNYTPPHGGSGAPTGG